MWGARRWDQLTPGYTADPGFALTDTTSWWGWQRAVEGSTRRCRGMNVVDGDFQTHPQVAVLKSAAERQLQSVVEEPRVKCGISVDDSPTPSPGGDGERACHGHLPSMRR